jgi:hypothetical protein
MPASSSWRGVISNCAIGTRPGAKIAASATTPESEQTKMGARESSFGHATARSPEGVTFLPA